MSNQIYVHNEVIHNENSGEVVLKFVFDLFEINSILDVGCGIGTWLSVAKKYGVQDLIGLDGEYVNRDLLFKYLNKDNFVAADLSKPIILNRKFDLTICLEVAEHLDEEFSEVLIDSLVNHSDCILFSAAIPGQGGQNHLNEQWPDYWRKLFHNKGFVFLDLIRPEIWNNPYVDYWYKQNTFLVVKNSHPLAHEFSESYLSLVHPELLERLKMGYEKRINHLENNLAVHPLKRWLKSLFKTR
jgi:SAM-dependent methyltransferase